MQSIDRIPVSSITPKEFATSYRSGEGRPVVITGALDNVPACTLEWLTAQLPAGKLQARYYGKEHFNKAKTAWKKYSEIIHVTPAEYAAMLVALRAHDENIYMAQVSIS